MTEELEQLLKNLQLRRMLEIYDGFSRCRRRHAGSTGSRYPSKMVASVSNTRRVMKSNASAFTSSSSCDVSDVTTGTDCLTDAGRSSSL
jgi:hypothetical protein